MSKKLRLMPYGVYLTTTDAVYFDRDYRPIVRLAYPGQIAWPVSTDVGAPVVTVCDPSEQIKFDSQHWFYRDANSPRRDRTTRAKLERLVASLPELAAEIARRSKSKVSA